MMPSLFRERTAPSMGLRRVAIPVVVTLSTVVVLSACSAESTSSPAAQSSPSTTSTGTAYPLTIDNCGYEVTFEQAPRRVMTAKSSTTELLLALGLGDSIVATTYLDGPIPDWLQEQAQGNEAIASPLAEQLPSAEAVLEVEPEVVYVGWESMLTTEGIADRDFFEDLGVHTIVAPSACKAPGYQPDPLTWEALFDEITTVGEIFDASEQAAQVVADQRAQLEAVTADDRGLEALWFSSGSDVPFVGGGIGSAQLIMDTVGVSNVGQDIDDTWGSMSWEAIVESNPDVIILVDASWSTADSKIEMLESQPAAAQLPAVKNKQYLVIDFPPTEAGVRTVSAAADLSRQLSSLELS